MDGPGWRLRHPRFSRTLGALVAGSVLGLLVWGAAGGAVAAPVPDAFRFMERHVGDAATYSASIETPGLWGVRTHAHADAFVVVRVMEDQLAIDRHGRPHAAHAIAQHTGFFGINADMPTDLFDSVVVRDFSLVAAHLYDVDDLAWLGQQVRLHHERVEMVQNDREGLAQHVNTWQNITVFAPDPHRDRLTLHRPLLCGVVNPLAGQRVPLADSVRLSSTCEAGTVGYDAFAFTAASSRLVAGTRCVTFQSGDLQLTFCEDRPFPVEVRVEVEGVEVVYRMQTFTRGEAPPRPVAVPPGAPLDLAMAPFHPYGADETGLHDRFPASAAYARLAGNATFEQWHREHPDAALRHGESAGGTDGWFFVFSHGLSELSGSVTPDTVQVEVHRRPTQAPAHVPLEVAPSVHSVAGAMETLLGATLDGWGVSHAYGCSDDPCGHLPLVRVTNATTRQEEDSLWNERRSLDVAGGGWLVTATEEVQKSVWAPPGNAGLGQEGPAIASIAVATGGAPEPPPYWLAASAAALAAVAAFAWSHLRWGILLFTRIGPRRLLDHPARARIMACILRDVGIHFASLRRDVDLPTGTLDFHLRKLVAAGVVKQRIANGHACYFPAATDRHVIAAAPYMQSGGARQVVEVVAANPGIDAAAVALATGLDPSTVRHHVRKLAHVLLLEAVPEGRRRRLHATPLAAKLLG